MSRRWEADRAGAARSEAGPLASPEPASEQRAPSLRQSGPDPELLHRVPAILYIADVGAEGRWHYVSPQIEAILGFAPEE
jgi:hypothetical protein